MKKADEGEPTARVPHCWAEGPPSRFELDQHGYPYKEIGSTCMLSDGHTGEHQFIPDDLIVLGFGAYADEARIAELEGALRMIRQSARECIANDGYQIRHAWLVETCDRALGDQPRTAIPKESPPKELK